MRSCLKIVTANSVYACVKHIPPSLVIEIVVFGVLFENDCIIGASDCLSTPIEENEIGNHVKEYPLAEPLGINFYSFKSSK